MKKYISCCIAVLVYFNVLAQENTSVAKDTLVDEHTALLTDSVIPSEAVLKEPKKKKSPASRAALLSTIVPGGGQIYNRKYWKLPLVYAAVGIPAYLYLDNRSLFLDSREAFTLASRKQSGDISIQEYTQQINDINPVFLNAVRNNQTESLRNYRNQTRQNMDYATIFFLVFWGLNIVDAAVDGHLKDFDISDDLSLHFKPGYSPLANTSGFSVILQIGKRPSNKSFVGR